jgi:hypothetical protein
LPAKTTIWQLRGRDPQPHGGQGNQIRSAESIAKIFRLHMQPQEVHVVQMPFEKYFTLSHRYILTRDLFVYPSY